MKYLICFVLVLSGCSSRHNYLLKINDSISGRQGYLNFRGDTIIPLGKYAHCTTDTFTNFAIVAIKAKGFVGINRSEKVLFEIYPFDNGPDYPSERLFRIVEKEKIGYADLNGCIIIKPRFAGAFPFENGLAKVTLNCTTRWDGDHSYWISDKWFYIDKFGVRFNKLDKTKY